MDVWWRDVLGRMEVAVEGIIGRLEVKQHLADLIVIQFIWSRHAAEGGQPEGKTPRKMTITSKNIFPSLNAAIHSVQVKDSLSCLIHDFVFVSVLFKSWLTRGWLCPWPLSLEACCSVCSWSPSAPSGLVGSVSKTKDLCVTPHRYQFSCRYEKSTCH